MGGTCERTFFSLYPTILKQPETEQGVWLRKTLLITCVVHFCLTLASLAIIGFWPMTLNLLQTCWSYSCYLTLREREVWFYLILLFIQAFYLVLHLLGFGDDTGDDSAFQTLGHLIAICCCGLVGWLVASAFYAFRKSGGLHGTLEQGANPILFEDKMLGKAKNGANVA